MQKILCFVLDWQIHSTQVSLSSGGVCCSQKKQKGFCKICSPRIHASRSQLLQDEYELGECIKAQAKYRSQSLFSKITKWKTNRHLVPWRRLSLGVTAPTGAAFQPVALQVEPGDGLFPCLGVPCKSQNWESVSWLTPSNLVFPGPQVLHVSYLVMQTRDCRLLPWLVNSWEQRYRYSSAVGFLHYSFPLLLRDLTSLPFLLPCSYRDWLGYSSLWLITLLSSLFPISYMCIDTRLKACT